METMVEYSSSRNGSHQAGRGQMPTLAGSLLFFSSYSIGFPCASHIQSRSSLLSLWKYSCQHSQKCALPTAFSRVCLPSTKSTGKVNHHRLLGQGCMLFFCACFCVWECACVRVRVPLAGLNKSSHWRGSAFLLTAHRGRTSI